MIAPVRSVYGFGRWSPATTNTMPSPATSINCASSEIASIDCGVTYWFAAVNARGRSGRSLLRSSKGGYHHPESCTHIRMLAFTLPILHKSRMRRRARTDLSGGALSDERPYRVRYLQTDGIPAPHAGHLASIPAAKQSSPLLQLSCLPEESSSGRGSARPI